MPAITIQMKIATINLTLSYSRCTVYLLLYVLDYPGFQSSQVKNIFLPSKVETKSVAHPASYFRGICVVLGEGVKWLKCDFDHSPASSTEVKNEWINNSSPTYAFKVFAGTSLPFISLQTMCNKWSSNLATNAFVSLIQMFNQ